MIPPSSESLDRFNDSIIQRFNNLHTDIFLITGFLGSGKTTFLNRIIKAFPQDRKLMILMNEFGEIGIDGRLVEDQDLDMLEISKGSIFCVCVKTDFIKGLAKIANDIRPDVLIIEATGVANPTDLKRDLKLSLFKDRFRFREQFCIIDAQNFEDAYDVFTSVEKQIESSTVFIINKTDLVTPADVCRVREIVERHHPRPVFLETTFAEISPDHFLSLNPPQPTAHETVVHEELSQEQIEAAIEALLSHPQSAITPLDLLASLIYTWKGTDLKAFSRWAENLPPSLVRAKGFVRQGDETYLFDWVMGKWEIKPVLPPKNLPEIVNRIVLIAHPEVMNQLESAMGSTPILSEQ